MLFNQSSGFVLAVSLVVALAGCAGSAQSDSASPGGKSRKSGSLDYLTSVMTGSFSSEIQSKEDTAFYDIRLEMVRIWTDRTDANWIYVEQALATYLDRPYRQRVYKLTEEPDGRFRSVVYTLSEPTRFINAWKDPAAFSTIGPANLELREGCDIVLTWEPDRELYTGKTGDKTCESNLRGARWATSEVELGKDGMISWDKGLDDDGNQIWGAETGGYRFNKLAPQAKR